VVAVSFSASSILTTGGWSLWLAESLSGPLLLSVSFTLKSRN
jgi:hypothetical protein